jgi:hypothetical protein
MFVLFHLFYTIFHIQYTQVQPGFLTASSSGFITYHHQTKIQKKKTKKIRTATVLLFTFHKNINSIT